jgi:hypothetical protein
MTKATIQQGFVISSLIIEIEPLATKAGEQRRGRSLLIPD